MQCTPVSQPLSLVHRDTTLHLYSHRQGSRYVSIANRALRIELNKLLARRGRRRRTVGARSLAYAGMRRSLATRGVRPHCEEAVGVQVMPPKVGA